MKLSFSMQYWADTPFSTLCQTARETGLKGVEMYDLLSDAFRGKSSPTNPELAAVTRRELVQSGLSIPCVDTRADFTSLDFPAEMQE